MTEQQRREQILKAREHQQRAPVPAMSDAEAQRIVAEGQTGLTEEQLLVTAMLGKFVQNDINGIKKAGMGDLKVSDVDMSKVMPSGIAKAMGVKSPLVNRPVPPPVPSAPVVVPVEIPVPVIEANVPVVEIQPPVQIQSQLQTTVHDNQLELPLDKKASYDDVYREISQINERINFISDRITKILTIIETAPKKKLKKELNGTQTG